MRLHVETRGHGPVRIAFVHGFLGAGPLWVDVVGALDPDRFTALLVDLRGHGASPRAGAAGRYSLAMMVTDLVETLPAGLDAVVGHSLGGRVLADAVAALQPGRAVYLDPGFGLRLPRDGVLGTVFWRTPGLRSVLAWAYDRVDRRLGPANAALVDAAHRQWDRSMAAEVLRDVAVHPVPPAPAVVPSTLVLSDDAPLVVPSADVARFAAHGWEVVRMRGIHHDVLLLDGPRTARVIEEAVLR